MLPYIKHLPAGTKADAQSCICYLSELQHCEEVLKACSTTSCSVAAHTSSLCFIQPRRNRVVSDHVSCQLWELPAGDDSNAAQLLGCYSGHPAVPRRTPTARAQAMRSHLVCVQPELTYSRCSTRSTTLSAAHVRSPLKSLSGLPLHACTQQHLCCLPKDLIALIKPCSSDEEYAHAVLGDHTSLTYHRFVCLDQLG